MACKFKRPEDKEKVLTTLRDPSIRQAIGAIRMEGAYCAVGAVALAVGFDFDGFARTLDEYRNNRREFRPPDAYDAVTELFVCDGEPVEAPKTGNRKYHMKHLLIEMNDRGGMTFPEIAEYLEANT